jgi:hypothetical protein
MKHMHFYLVLALIVVLTTVLAGPGCGIKINTGGAAGTQAAVSDATLSTGIDSESKPLNASNTFTVTADAVYLSFKLNNAPANTQVTAKVTYLSGEASNMANQVLFNNSLSGQGTKYMAFTVKPPPGGFPQGNYQVTLVTNGKDTINLPFTVQNLATQKGWPVISKFTSSADTVSAGQPVTLDWVVTDATRVTLQPEVGTVPNSGTRSITPSATTTFKLIASNDTGATTREITVNVGAAVTGAPDLVVTEAWLEGCMIYYKIKNIGGVDSPSSTTYLYYDNMFPPLGGTSFCDLMKPGQERTLVFSSYQWPDCGQTPGGTQGDHQFGTHYQLQQSPHSSGPTSYVDPGILNHVVKICADGKNDVKEGNKNNNCLMKLWGILFDYDMLPLAHLADWKNSAGEMPAFGSEGSTTGAYIKLGDGGVEMIPDQVPQGWIQGYWGAFSVSPELHTPQTAAIKLPAKTHLRCRVGLANNAQGSDGVTFKVGLKDLTDMTNFLPGKKMTVPGVFEDWDLDLGDYEGQKVLIILRVEAGSSPTNDFAIWKQARLMQVSP